MASHSRRDNDHSMFTSKTTHFFKVILHETIRDGVLGLPRRFVRKYGNQLSSQVKLEVPSGAIWQVELTEADEKMRMEKGWREFAERYSLEYGSFVVFRYEGNDHFQVLVFDKTATEIEYPYCTSKEDDNDLCDEVSASRKNKEKLYLPCPLPRKKMRTASPYKTETNANLKFLSSHISLDDPNSRKIKLGNLKKKENSRSSTGKVDGVGGISARQSVKTEGLNCSQNLTATETAHAIQIANAFKSTGNPLFMVVMRPSFISDKYRMRIPPDFAREFLTVHNCNLTLCNSAGKTWPAKYCTNPKFKCLKSNLYGGWRSFVEDNHLNVGDICVFELIKQHPIILMKVVINPVVGNASNACRPQVSRKSKEKSHLPCPLPRKEMGTESPNQPRTNSKLEVLSSDINPHDSMSRKINVGYLKKVEKSPRNLDALRSFKTEAFSCVQLLTDTEKAHAVQIASAFKSTGNPVFMVVMQPSFVCERFRMCIPSDFARDFLPKRNTDLILLDSSGKTWPVKYRCHGANKKLRAKLCGGWRAFVEDNHLYVGDICVFELIMHPEILMKVVVYPVFKNLSLVSWPPAHGTIASRGKTRSLVSKTEPNCQQSSYPSSSRKREHPSDSYIEILDDSPLNQKTKKKLTSSSFHPQKVMRTNPSGSTGAKGIKLEKEKKSMNSQYSTKELCGEIKHSAKDDSAKMTDVRRCLRPDLMGEKKMEPLTPTEKQKGCVGASGSRTSNPSFSVVMQPSYVRSFTPLHIPEEFARRYLQRNGEMSLRVPDGKTWTVEYKRFAINGGIKSTFSSKSWRAFVRDNELNVGDVCTFELIKENGNFLLEVVIQRKL